MNNESAPNPEAKNPIPWAKATLDRVARRALCAAAGLLYVGFHWLVVLWGGVLEGFREGMTLAGRVAWWGPARCLRGLDTLYKRLVHHIAPPTELDVAAGFCEDHASCPGDPS